MSLETDLFSETPNVNTQPGTPAAISRAANCIYRSRLITSGASINPLVAAADSLLLIAGRLTTSTLPADRNKLQQDLVHEIKAFEHRAQMANYGNNIILAARYALCALLDEIIMSSAWGKDNNWGENSLNTALQQEKNGGTKVFTIIERALEDVANNIDLIELLYVIISLGFMGKYREQEHGQSELAVVTNKLYQAIYHYRHYHTPTLWVQDAVTDTTTPAIQPIMIKPINTSTIIGFAVGLALIISAAIYTGTFFKLRNISKPLYPLIEQIINLRK